MGRCLTGRLLVATPTLEDPNFRRTVVLMLDHGDDGALGIVVNRPLDVDVSAVLPAWQPYTTEPGPLFQGGPVQLDSALGLVAVPGDGREPDGVRRIIGSLGLVDLDTPPDALAGRPRRAADLRRLRRLVDGQLEGEIERGRLVRRRRRAARPVHRRPAGPLAPGAAPPARRPRAGLHLPGRPVAELSARTGVGAGRPGHHI